MNIVAELQKIALALDSDEKIRWKIENIDIWGSADFGSFETEKFATRHEIGKACVDYLVENHPDMVRKTV